KFIDADLTAEQRERAINALSAGDRALVTRRSILPSEKVSEFTLNHLTVCAAEAKGESLDRFGRRAGAAELKDALGIYRFLTSVLTPTALLRKASTMWSTVHSHGAMTVEDVTDDSARILLTAFPSEEAHCARLTGWMEALGDMTGVRRVAVLHDVCMTKGDADCQWHLRWARK
ncbi:MAG: hypothetical protein JWO56_1304, partial [Acidobacteria bacterium]|nr:hypothetical protein [Acidobacteriota bacterium]